MAQQPGRQPSGPEQVVIAVLEAACSEDAQEFSPYLLADSRRAFGALPGDEQAVLLKRFSLTSVAGHARPLLDAGNRMVVRCETPSETVTFRLGTARIDGNVASVPITVNGIVGEQTNFGLVRQPGGWRLLSLGLLVINVPGLVRQWEEAEMRANEQACVADLVSIEQGVKTYDGAFGRWPEKLEQLGPAPPSGVSPEHAQLIAERLATGAADGYRLRYRLVTGTNGTIEGFELGAVPEQYDKTGRQSFFMGIDGKLHAADKQGRPATGEDPVITPPAVSEP